MFTTIDFIQQDTAGAFQNIPVPENIMEFHVFLMNNNSNNLQHYIHKYHNTHQQLLEELKNVRYNMVETQQEIDSIEDTLTYRHQLYQQLTYQQQTLNAEKKALQDIICKKTQHFTTYNIPQSAQTLYLMRHPTIKKQQQPRQQLQPARCLQYD
ncbi:hypothetical protein DPMN_144755 [Dreissena polymorpha]|uniref:Uncharacterized protein n=1 Tax=Dreissena polymorpha TaxID=45954 RepID=A0A9D4J0M3_DREPO|nr:hypothetical protein DPMN_144755 [Dreissena polymorpha]